MLRCVSYKYARRSSKLSTPCIVKSVHTMSDLLPNRQPARPNEVLVKGRLYHVLVPNLNRLQSNVFIDLGCHNFFTYHISKKKKKKS